MPTFPAPVRRPQRVTMLRTGHAGGAAHKRRGALASKRCRRAGQCDERRHAHTIGQPDSGVGENQGPTVELGGSTDGDRTTPVVGGHHHRAGSVLTHKRHQFADALGQDARRTPTRKPHAGLVHGHHPPPRRRLGHKVLPDVRPRGIAVGAHQRATHRIGAIVEDVPSHGGAVGGREVHQARPRRIQAPVPHLGGGGPVGLGDHQTSSAMEQFSPDPMPHNRIRSPECRSPDTIDSV